MENKFDVYVRVNTDGYIVSCEGGRTIDNVTNNPQFNWILIDSGSEARHEFCQTKYFDGGLYSEGGAFRYKLVDGVPVECSAKEIAAQEKALKPKTIAPRNIVEGEYITVSGVLYKATSNIPIGERIVTGQNAIETTVEEQLAELAKGE